MSKTLGSLTVGAKIEVPVLSAYQSRFGSKIVFKIADKNHSGYPSNSVTLITEKIIQLMCFDAKEPSNSKPCLLSRVQKEGQSAILKCSWISASRSFRADTKPY